MSQYIPGYAYLQAGLPKPVYFPPWLGGKLLQQKKKKKKRVLMFRSIFYIGISTHSGLVSFKLPRRAKYASFRDLSLTMPASVLPKLEGDEDSPRKDEDESPLRPVELSERIEGEAVARFTEEAAVGDGVQLRPSASAASYNISHIRYTHMSPLCITFAFFLSLFHDKVLHTGCYIFLASTCWVNSPVATRRIPLPCGCLQSKNASSRLSTRAPKK